MPEYKSYVNIEPKELSLPMHDAQLIKDRPMPVLPLLYTSVLQVHTLWEFRKPVDLSVIIDLQSSPCEGSFIPSAGGANILNISSCPP